MTRSIETENHGVYAMAERGSDGAVLGGRTLRRRALATTSLMAIALGAAAELTQTLVGRNAGLDDLLADAVGVFAVWAPMQAVEIRRRIGHRLHGDGHAYGRRAGDRGQARPEIEKVGP